MKTATSLYALIVSLVFLIGTNLHSQTTILEEDFEDGTVGYVANPVEISDGSEDYFARIGGTGGASIASAMEYFSPIGTGYFAAHDLDADPGVSEAILTWSGLNISGFTNLEFSGYFAEDDDGTNQDWDDEDGLAVEVRIDGGAWTPIFAIENDGSTFNSAPLVDTDFDGTGDGSEITDTFTQYTASISGTGSLMDLRIRFIELDSGDEDIAIDSIVLEGISGGPASPGLLITESGASTDVTEGGATDTFDVELLTQPITDVTVNLSTAAPSEITFDVSSLTFTMANWNTPQTVTVTAVDDSDIEGNHTGSIDINTTSADTNYNTLTDSFNANITDNDSAPVATNIIINEVDADTPGTDALEFIELYDGGTGNTALDGLVVVLFNGSDDQSYDAIDLDGESTDANGFFVIGSASVSNVDLTAFTTNGLQNGADAVALYVGDDADFPDDTTLSTASGFTLVDAVVYDTSDSDDTVLINGLTPGQPQIDEAANGDKDNHSISRLPDGGTQLDTSSYVAQASTPGTSNGSAPTPAGFTVTESGGSTDVTEGGATDSFDVVLDSAPTSSVTVDISTPSPAEVSFSSASLTFTTTDWSTPQTVTVTAVDDSDAEGAHTATIDFSTTSADTGFDGLSDTITANITDDEPAPTFLYNADFGTEDDGFPDHTTSSPPAVGPTSANGGAAISPEGRWTVSYDTAPSTDSTANELSVNGGVLRIQDWGDQDARFESFSIDVSAVNAISISATGVTIGSNVQNTTPEFFQYFHTLDGGADVVADVNLSGDTAGTSVDYSVPSLDVSGVNTLTVGFNFNVDAGGDGYEISSFTVTEISGPGAPGAPTGFSAEAVDKDQIDLSWSETSGNDVLIVFNTEDDFGIPSDGTSYVGGDAIGNATVLGVYSNEMASHTGLCPAKTYYYQAWSVTGTTYSSAQVPANTTTPTYDLENSSWDSWTVVDVTNTDTWITNGGFASGTGFDGSNGVSGVSSEAWLVSPALDLDSFEDETFEFDYRSEFNDIGKSAGDVGLEMFYTTNYTGDPGSTSWTSFTSQNSDFVSNVTSDGSETADISANVDLSGISGNAVVIAFRYTSTGEIADQSYRWELLDPLVSGNDSGIGSITLTPLTDPVTEGGTTDLQVTLSPAPATATTVDVCIVGSDDSEVVENGESDLDLKLTVDDTGTATVTLSAVDDSSIDGDQTVTLTANVEGYLVQTATVTVQDNDGTINSSDLIISQYYEGSGSNKWIELKNVGSTSIDLSNYTITRWANAGRDGWKSDGGMPTNSTTLSGMLAPGELYLIGRSDASLPSYALNNLDLDDSGIANFNGDDSVVLYNNTGSPFNTADIADAIGFSSANEGADTSWVRSDNGPGYDFGSSDVEDFPTQWTEFSNSAVDSASSSNDEYLGEEAVSVSVTILASSINEDDGSAATSGYVVLSAPAPAGGTVVNLASSDPTEASVPVSVTVAASQTQSPNFDIAAVDDSGVFDPNVTVTITGSGTGLISGSEDLTVINTDAPSGAPALIITQIHVDDQSPAFNNFIEVTNISGSTIAASDLDDYTVALFSAGTGENWKSDGTADQTFNLPAVALTDGQSLVLYDLDANGPDYAIGSVANDAGAEVSQMSNSFAFELFGLESIGLYNGAVAFANLVDMAAIDTTDTLTNQFLLRLNSTSQAFSTIPGETWADYASAWERLAVTDTRFTNADSTDNEYLGEFPGGGSSGPDFNSFISSQSGAGSSAVGGDKNDNGVLNEVEYAFRDVDPTDEGVVGDSSDNVVSQADLRELLGGDLSDAGTPATTSDDQLVYTILPPTPADSDVTIYVVGSSVINDVPDVVDGGSDDATNNTDVIATYSGSAWTQGTGTVSVATGPGGSDEVTDAETIGNSASRFVYVIVDIQ